MAFSVGLSGCDSEDPDVVPPVVALNGAAVMTVSYRDGFSDPGATARDDRDGTVAVTVTGEVPPEAGEYTLTYTATDAAGNAGRATRTVRVVDDVPPVVTLNGDAVIAVSYAEPLTDPGATATDEHDGALAVTVSGELGSDIGEYILIYTATDAAGNVGRVERTVRVVDDVPPVIMLNGPASAVLERDEPYLEPGAVAEDDIDGPVETTVTGEVSEAAGEYTLVYRATDAAGNVAEARRTVTRAPGDYMLEVDVFGEGEVLLAAGLATTPFECEDGRCFGRFQEGERVELEAYAASGRRFDGWGTGVCDETPSPQRCTLMMDRDRIALPAFVSEAPLTLNDDVVELTEEQLEGLVFWAQDVGVAVFEGWTDLDMLAPGAVMVSYGAPDEDGFPTEPMFLARVLSVTRTPSGSQMVTTLPAGLDDLYASGTLIVRAELTEAVLARAKLAPGVKLALPQPENSSRHECPLAGLYTHTRTYTPRNQGPLTDICVTLGVTAAGKWEKDDKFLLLSLGTQGSVTIREGHLRGRILLGTLGIPTTPPVAFVRLSLYLRPEGRLKGDFSLPVSANATLTVGGTYKRKRGPNINAIYSSGVGHEIGAFEGTISRVDLQLGLEAAARVEVAGVVGTEISGEPYFGASLEPRTSDCALRIEPYRGVNAEASFDAGVWKLRWRSRPFNWETGRQYIHSRFREVSINCRPTPPTPPSNLTAQLADARGVQLSWPPSEGGATSYRVYRGGRKIEVTSRTTHLDSNPPTGENCYRVRAENQAGRSSHSPEACATVPRREDPRPTRPAKPVVRVDVVEGITTLIWTEEGGVDYWLWAELSGVWKDLNFSASSPLPVKVPETPGRELCYRIRAQSSTDAELWRDSDPSCFTPVGTNAPPIAKAGDDQSVVSGTPVRLRGRGEDRDGRVSGYTWTQTGGQDVSLRDAHSPDARFTAPNTDAEERLEFQLTVTDDDGATGSDRVRVTVWPASTPGNDPPRADAGRTQRVTAGDRVRLSGRGSDDDRGRSRLTYHWEHYRGRPKVVLSSATSRDVTFVAPSVSQNTDLRFRLTVTDGHGATDTDRVLVRVSPAPPVADAGPNLSVTSGDRVTLSGSGTGDRDIVAWRWEQYRGRTVILSGANSQNATFVAPSVSEETDLRFRLTVTDEDGATDSDTVRVTVSPSANQPPVADAGGDQSVASGTAVTLAGSGSDPDGLVVGYTWAQTAGPTVALTGAAAATATFTAPAVTIQTPLTFRLSVTDNVGATGTDEATVTVSPPGANRPPVADAGDDQSAASGTAVTLAGSGSDTDGRVVEYAWTQTAGPTVALTGAAAATATFTAPEVTARTTLTFRLTVTDDDGATDGDEATVAVTPPGPNTLVNIRDHALRANLLRIMGKSAGDTITVSDMAGLTAIAFGQKSIKDLTGLEFATNLTYLELNFNYIADVSPLANLKSLTTLYLHANRISNISALGTLTSLTRLNLGSNFIADVSPLGALTSLTTLDLSRNLISDHSTLGTFTSLTWLDLRHNSITDVSALGALTSLAYLALSHNTISDISPLSTLTSLTSVILSNNSISAVSPLVDNIGLGSGDNVDISFNPLDTDSVNIHIPALRARGVSVHCSLVDGTEC